MGNKANPTLIGAFMLGAVALLVASVLVFSRSTWFTETQAFVLYFPSSVNGLNLGAPVTFDGVQIGQVTHLAVLLNQKDFTSVKEVEIQMQPEALTIITVEGIRRAGQATSAKQQLASLIAHGLRASLQLQSFVTGLLYIEVGFQPGTPVHLVGLQPDMPEIPTVPSAMNQMLSTVQKTLQQLGQLPLDDFLHELIGMVQEAKTLLQDPTLKQTMKSVAMILQEFQQLVATISNQVPGLVGKIDNTLDAVPPVLREAQALVRDVGRQVAPLSGSAQETLAAARGALLQATQSLARLEKVAVPMLAQADKVLKDAEGVVAPDAVLLSELNQTLTEIAGAARSLRELTDYLERHPEALVRGRR